MSKKQALTTVTPPINDDLPNHYDGFHFDDEGPYVWDLKGALADKLDEIKRGEAAAFVRLSAVHEESFCDSYDLLEIFNWSETRFGYTFWEEIYWELVTDDYQNEPDEQEMSYYGITQKQINKANKKANKKRSKK